jgi:hypothetical protein
MNIEQRLLNALKTQQTDFALEGLKRPLQRDAFEYGYRTGIVNGLELAINTLLDLVKDEREGDKDL